MNITARSEAVMALACALAFVAASASSAASDRPNFLWISCEDTSTVPGCYGDTYAKTPNLDALAATALCILGHEKKAMSVITGQLLDGSDHAVVEAGWALLDMGKEKVILAKDSIIEAAKTKDRKDHPYSKAMLMFLAEMVAN